MTATGQLSDFLGLDIDESQRPAFLAKKFNIMESAVSKKIAAATSNVEELKSSSDSEDSEICSNKYSKRSRSNLTEESEVAQVQPSDTESKTETAPTCSSDEWLDIMGSGDFKKKVIKPGSGEKTRPVRGDRVTVNISYYINGNLFEKKKDFNFIVGDLDVVQGIDMVICLMEKGETSRVKIPFKLGYGVVGLRPHVPTSADIECEIELKEIEPVDQYSLSVSEGLKLGEEKRTRGNFLYGRGEYLDAIHCYGRAADYLDGVRNCADSSPQELQEVVDMRLKVYNNLAASHLKLAAYSPALKSVESVLKVQPKNVKALYRKGKILATQGRTDEALACLRLAASLEPETKAIQKELTKLNNKRKKEIEHQREMCRRMFKTEPKKSSESISTFKKWSMISCGVLAVAIGSAVAFRQLHT